MNKNIRDFTTGSIPKALLYFSIPFFLTNLIQAFYSIADIMVISRFCGCLLYTSTPAIPARCTDLENRLLGARRSAQTGIL